MNSDAELLRRYVSERSDTAFAELVQRHVGMVHGAALRHVAGDPHLAEDVVQTVFVSLARKARALQDRRTLAGWLYLSTHHAAAQMVRTESRRRKREETHAMQEQLTKEPATEWERVRDVLDPAMRELGEVDRDAVLLRYFEQRPFAEIGAALNVSDDAARMRVERALEKLRGVLGRRGITSTGAALGAVLASQASVAPPAGLISEVTSVAITAARAPGAGGSIFSMNTPLAAVSTVAVIAIATAVYQARQAQHATAELTMLAKQRDEALAQVRVAQQSAGELEQRLSSAGAEAAMQRRDAPAVRATAAAEDAPTGSSPAPGKVVTWKAIGIDGTPRGSYSHVDTPEGRRNAVREAVGKIYGAFFRKMGWSDQQQEEFKSLCADRKEAGQQMFQDAIARGTIPSRTFAKQVTDDTGRDFDAKLRATFGEGVVESMRDFEAKRPFRKVADDLADRLFYSDTPLSNWQAEQLIDLMANSARTPQGRFDIGSMETGVVISQAQGILSAPQLARFREVEAERRNQHELEQRILAERAGAPPATVPPPTR